MDRYPLSPDLGRASVSKTYWRWQVEQASFALALARRRRTARLRTRVDRRSELAARLPRAVLWVGSLIVLTQTT